MYIMLFVKPCILFPQVHIIHAQNMIFTFLSSFILPDITSTFQVFIHEALRDVLT